jgi:hypothetical protein
MLDTGVADGLPIEVGPPAGVTVLVLGLGLTPEVGRTSVEVLDGVEAGLLLQPFADGERGLMLLAEDMLLVGRAVFQFCCCDGLPVWMLLVGADAL